MATFVLVHGAWHGGWCWARTEAALQAMGHRTLAPTLTGLADRSHLLHAGITPDLHVQDVVNLLIWQELHDVILVGHSYGGMIVTGVASQVPERLRALVYLDAFVPEQSGMSLFANANPERMANFQAQMDAGAIALEPDLFDAWSADDDTKAWLRRQCTPQPVKTFTEGVTLTGREADVPHRHFILAEHNRPSAFWGEYERVKDRPGWTSERMPTKHDAMVDAPEDLAGRLDGYLATLG
ncbi:MAG: alpha/beta fold hydrolase [Paracoccaceae bacterium]